MKIISMIGKTFTMIILAGIAVMMLLFITK